MQEEGGLFSLYSRHQSELHTERSARPEQREERDGEEVQGESEQEQLSQSGGQNKPHSHSPGGRTVGGEEY